MRQWAKDVFVIIFVSLYLIGALCLAVYGLTMDLRGVLPEWLSPYLTEVNCVVFGLLGGVLYCIRAVYLNKCVRDTWDDKWLAWYILRPIAASILGGMSNLFVATGLLAFSDAPEPTKAVYIVAFFAGLNVDRFLKKLEGQVSSSLSIEPSREGKDT